jgi:hypothetical protein
VKKQHSITSRFSTRPCVYSICFGLLSRYAKPPQAGILSSECLGVSSPLPGLHACHQKWDKMVPELPHPGYLVSELNPLQNRVTPGRILGDTSTDDFPILLLIFPFYSSLSAFFLFFFPTCILVCTCFAHVTGHSWQTSKHAGLLANAHKPPGELR